MGIVDSLSAGYRFLTKRLDLLLIPLCLDLFLWATPRLTIRTLFERVSQLYLETAKAAIGTSTETSTVTEDMMPMIEEASKAIAAFGESSNLLSLLVNNSLVRMPSLIVLLEPLAGTQNRDMVDPYTVVGWGVLLSIVGLGIGVIYMELMARYLPIGALPKATEWPEFVRRVFRHWGLLILWVAVIIICGLALMIPVALAITLMFFVSPSLASLLTLFLGGMVMILYFYLYFVAAGLILDNLTLYQSVAQSFVLVRNRFWKTLGFILLTNFISMGCGLLFYQLAIYQPFGTLSALLINAYIGSGLVMALFIFYRSQLITPEELELVDS